MATYDADDVGGVRPAPPPPPPQAPSDWTSVVHASAWADLARLGRWTGGSRVIPSGTDPSPFFAAVAPRSLGAGSTPAPIYVVVHGWAPGYLPLVQKAGGNVQWWSPGAQVAGRWASDWCWSPVAGSTISVDTTGVVQQVVAFDSTATVLAYSWIDDSATASGVLNLSEVYRSEAYTHLNGIRLANALENAVAPSFFAAGGEIRLIGHSHGSRVGTVAAMTLQQRGHPATHLSILDSPEWDPTLAANGANLLAFYLEQLDIGDPSGSTGGLYVDSYASYFGVTYASAAPRSPIGNVVQVGLNPSPVYGSVDPSDCHTYAAAWYGGAAAGAAAAGDPPIGLAWPPVPAAHTPTINQRWGSPGQDQWLLTPGTSRYPTYRYATHPLAVTKVATQGPVSFTGGTLVLGPAGAGQYTIFEGRYAAQHTDQYGIAFDLKWASPLPGTYFVVSIGHDGGSDTYTLLVLDGASLPTRAWTSIAINSDVWWATNASVRMYYWGIPQNPADAVVVSNIRYVEVAGA
ncbi:MAG TPA: hypothetical protein VF228_06525 [Iamia sp.]